MRKATIGMLLDVDFPPDTRVENEMRSLASAGYDVHLLCYDFSGKRPLIEAYSENITVHRFRISRTFHNKFNVVALTVPAYFHAWTRQATRFVAQHGIDILHVHDLRLAEVGRRIKNAFHIPYVLDLHENYPAALKVYAFANTLLGRLLVSIDQWERYERRQVGCASYIISVIEEMKDRIRSLSAPEDRIFVVPNYIHFSSFDEKALAVTLDKREQEIALIYSGGFDLHRGLETLLDAMKILQSDQPNLRLHLVGSGRTESQLREKASAEQIRNVEFHGWQKEHAIPSFIGQCDIGVIPHLKNEQNDFTIPHKLFHYMYKRKPLLVSDCAPLQRIVRKSQAGLIFRSGDPEDLAAKLVQLSSDPQRREEFGRNGYDAIIREYNWERSADQLLHLYGRIGIGKK
ncbi:MAG: glycosyltransferase family 4 protein [Candidatus Zhuqueibacterota bacterium]